ncbi:MAG: Cof-type HAD-IIB family hydrolase [Bacillaceae bacterium]
MEKYLIALDLDGTLLKNDKTISARNQKAINKVRSLGHEVVIATGRPYRASHQYYKQLKLTTPIINFNGAYIHHPNGDFPTLHSPMKLNNAKQIIQECDGIGINNVFAEVVDDVYLRYEDKRLDFISHHGNPRIIKGDPLTTLQDNPTSLLLDAKEEEVERIQKHLSHFHAEIIDHRRWASPFHVIEILQTGLNKAAGLEKVCHHYNIPSSRLIAFGDEDNDKEMLQYAQYGVAMGNGLNEMKEIAKDITSTNEEDGVAAYLESFFEL